ncbi:hypothetical protein [Pseudomonas sp. dw_358]|uniref:hypothetical protein n=1 Tax=Pseudomonas sp. dw_358 TaxID=2720083 RepID=UPI001BD63931|nr:hypothetical protein [Pseudomonas sp. dw_358]
MPKLECTFNKTQKRRFGPTQSGRTKILHTAKAQGLSALEQFGSTDVRLFKKRQKAMSLKGTRKKWGLALSHMP